MEALKSFLPTVLVFLAFIAALGAYVVLAIQGSDTGPIDELAIGLGGAVSGVAVAGRAAQPPS